MAIQYLNRSINLPDSVIEIKNRFIHDQWLMTDAERSVLEALLGNIKPECSIEIGTYEAGSLGILSKYSGRVYTIDIDPKCRSKYSKIYSNVKFICGNSKEKLPALLESIIENNEQLGFILIDGNHTEIGVRTDIESILQFKPTRPLYIIIHDSFNPDCRRGILKANWSSNPYVHVLESDYVVGRLSKIMEEDNTIQMWCGFALAVMLPEKREKDIFIHQNESLMYKTAYWLSSFPWKLIKKFHSLSRLKWKIKKIMVKCFYRD